MIIKIIDKDFTVIWDGIFYKKLSNYPEISDWELRTIIEFIEYENKYNRTCQIECEDKNLLDKINKEEIAKKGGKFVNEFKDFIAKGNVLDLAVGVVIGSAFGKIVSSIVDDIIMPIVGALIGGIDFTGLSIKIGNANITYGNFIQNVIDFLIIAFCIFIFVKVINKLHKEEKKEPAPVKPNQEVLLEEIRDLLKKDKE